MDVVIGIGTACTVNKVADSFTDALHRTCGGVYNESLCLALLSWLTVIFSLQFDLLPIFVS